MRTEDTNATQHQQLQILNPPSPSSTFFPSTLSSFDFAPLSYPSSTLFSALFVSFIHLSRLISLLLSHCEIDCGTIVTSFLSTVRNSGGAMRTLSTELGEARCEVIFSSSLAILHGKYHIV